MLFGNSFLGIHQISGAHCIQSSSSNKNRSLERHMFTIKLPPLPPIPIGKVCCGSQKISQKSDVGALLRTLGVMLPFVHLTSLVLSIFFIRFFFYVCHWLRWKGGTARNLVHHISFVMSYNFNRFIDMDVLRHQDMNTSQLVQQARVYFTRKINFQFYLC